MGARSHTSQATERPEADPWAGQAPPGDQPGGGGGKVRAGSGCEDPRRQGATDQRKQARRAPKESEKQRRAETESERDRGDESLRQGEEGGGVGTGGRWGTGAALASVVPRPPGTLMPTAPVPEALSLARSHSSSWEGNGFILAKGPGSR